MTKQRADLFLRVYFKLLSVAYFFALLLHVLDILNLRHKFSEMNILWQLWVVYLALVDFIAALGLWNGGRLGELMFLAVALSQLAVYLGWSEVFGNQYQLIGFHFFTLGIYLILLTFKVKVEARHPV
jgi:hypothetical protein